MEKKKYTVMIPIAGFLEVDVDATSEKEAIASALVNEDQHKKDNITVWESYEKLSYDESMYGEIEVYCMAP